MKKIISLLLIIAITVSIFPPTKNNQVHAAQIFSDLPETHWAAESVSTLVSLDLVHGYPDDTFQPDNPIKIEEFVKLIVGALGYTDLPKNYEHWSIPYFEKADELGLFVDEKNYVNVRGQFWGNKSNYIIRAEAAFLLVQAEKIIQNGEINYEASQEFIKSQIEDMDSIYPQYQDAVINAYGLGLLNGFPDDTFQPDGNLTRAQAAVVICRLLFEEQRTPLMPINTVYSTTSQTWKPSESLASTDNIIHWESITYLTKLEALSIYAGLDDPELVAEIKLAKEIVDNAATNTLAFLAGSALKSFALQNGWNKLAYFATGLGSALVLGQMTATCAGVIQDSDKNEFLKVIAISSCKNSDYETVGRHFLHCL